MKPFRTYRRALLLWLATWAVRTSAQAATGPDAAGCDGVGLDTRAAADIGLGIGTGTGVGIGTGIGIGIDPGIAPGIAPGIGSGIGAGTGSAAGTAMILLAAPPDAVQQALLATITRLPDSHPRRRRYRLAVAFGTPLFPPDHLLREAPGQPYDTALDRWLALPPIQRRHDVVLLPDEDYYWRDAQAGDGYAAHFLVHLAAMQGTAGAPGTTLDIIQLHARRRHGKTLRLLGRAGPGLYWDIRPVAPSPAATAALAADLAQWLGAAPGRR